MSSLARRIGCTEGQLYTSGLGLLVAVALLAIGIPPVLRAGGIVEPSQAAASTEQPAATAPAPAPPPVPDLGTATPMTRPPARPVTASPVARPPAAAPASPTSPSPAAVDPKDDGLENLSVLSSGYTSTTAGTPLSGPEVPEDGMPVGARLGRSDKVSFLRLAGSGTVLHLRLVDDPAAHVLVPLAAVEACAITEEGWSLAEPGASPDVAPAHDRDRCAPGHEGADGTWRFDLASLQPLDGDVGIALLPVIEGATTFQVTFSSVASPPPRRMPLS